MGYMRGYIYLAAGVVSIFFRVLKIRISMAIGLDIIFEKSMFEHLNRRRDFPNNGVPAFVGIPGLCSG